MKRLRIPETVRTFGDAIRWARTERGITLRALAREVGVSPPFQSDLEHGRRTTSRMAEYARVLGVAVKDLESRQGVTADLREWLNQRPEILELLRDIRRNARSTFILRQLARRQGDG